MGDCPTMSKNMADVGMATAPFNAVSCPAQAAPLRVRFTVPATLSGVRQKTPSNFYWGDERAHMGNAAPIVAFMVAFLGGRL